jgi:hypothetical protein
LRTNLKARPARKSLEDRRPATGLNWNPVTPNFIKTVISASCPKYLFKILKKAVSFSYMYAIGRVDF